MTDQLTYSNPRMEATISDWPYGKFRTIAHFTIETTSRGQRAIRTTVDPKSGRLSAPKMLTFAVLARIVDGSDGRTYIAEENGSHITIMRGDMKYQHETIFPDNPRYPEAKHLFA